MENEFDILEIKFNHFLNLTIIGASKDYYKKQRTYEEKEIKIIDNENFEDYLAKYIIQDEDEIFAKRNLYGQFDNPELNNAFEKSLSFNEKMVIFLYFNEGYRVNIIAKILRMNVDSITRLKRKALEKLRNNMKGVDFDE